MRTLTEAQTAALYSSTGHATALRVRVQDGLGTWWDLSNLQGYNWLSGCSWSETVDNRVSQAQVELVREVADYSLAPLVTDSTLYDVDGSARALLAEGRLFVVEVALLPSGRCTVQEADYLEVFRGRIDDVDAGGKLLRFSGRDLGGALEDTLIEEMRDYGSPGGTALETVLQEILDDNGLSSVTLSTPVSPGLLLGPYKQRKVQVLEALQALADQIGWDVRYKSSGATLTLWVPDRAAAVPSWTFDRGAYRELSTCRTSRRDVRNRVRVTYGDTADLDAAGKPTRKTVVAEDLTSQAAVGLRTLDITEGASSNIDTAVEAQRMADAALSDLAALSLQLEAEVMYHPGLELGDLVAFSGPSRSFTATQSGGVVALAHSFSGGKATTRVTVRGKPSTGRMRWLEMQGDIPLLAVPFSGPNPPTSVQVASTVNGLAVKVAPPTTGPRVSEYEVHVGDSSSFTPSSSTLLVSGSADRLETATLLAGTGKWVAVRSKDSKGNVSALSTPVEVTPRYVEPRLIQPYTASTMLPRNGDFEAANNPLTPPDTWTMAIGTWGTDAAVETTTVYSGSRSLMTVARAVTGTELTAEPFVVREGDRLGVRAVVASSASGVTASMRIDWLDSVFSLISSISIDDVTFPGGLTWLFLSGIGTAPTGARFARLRIRSGPDGSNPSVYWDSVQAFPLATVLSTPVTVRSPDYGGVINDYLNGWRPYLTGGRYGATYYLDNAGVVHIEGMVWDGSVGGAVFNLPAGYRPPYTRDFAVSADGGHALVIVYATGNVVVDVGGSATWTSLDGITFRVA